MHLRNVFYYAKVNTLVLRVIFRCWVKDPGQRPDFAQVFSEINQVWESIKASEIVNKSERSESDPKKFPRPAPIPKGAPTPIYGEFQPKSNDNVYNA
jgi:hypothetical protein